MHDFTIRENFQDELIQAQSGDERVVEHILLEFAPLIRKYQYLGQRPDADLLSELFLAAYLCIMRFQVDRDDMRDFLAEAQKLFDKDG